VLAEFVVLLEKWNRVYNLTGTRDRRTLLDRHIVESLALGPLLQGIRVADVGSGAGLPGLPLAIAQPDRQFTLIESRRKRVNFMRHVCIALGIANVTVAHGRAEDLSCPEPFATVLARAVAAPAQLLKIIRPLTTDGSILVLLTSTEIGREVVGMADDFAEVALPPGFGAGLRSAVVVLERVGSRRLGNSDG
jgi:16S rRNA (guanine527-N7)-methyltransferase